MTLHVSGCLLAFLHHGLVGNKSLPGSVDIMTSGPWCVQKALESLQERAKCVVPMRTPSGVASSCCTPKGKLLQWKKNLYLHKNTPEPALLAVSFEVIFRLIFQSKIFNYCFSSFFFLFSPWFMNFLATSFSWLIKLSSCLLLQLLPNSSYCWVVK